MEEVVAAGGASDVSIMTGGRGIFRIAVGGQR